MDMDRTDLAIFATDESTSCECLQVAPMGGNRAAILYLLADPDYTTTVSLIFLVQDFDADSADNTVMTDEWLMSLTAAPSGQLFALEATNRIWRRDQTQWTQERISDHSLRKLWGGAPGGPLVVGSDGMAYRYNGARWQAISPLAPVQYFDVHGNAKHGIHACGEQGTLHRLAGATWQPQELNRGERFRGIDVAPDGTIRLAGDDSLCLRVADEEMTEIEASETTYFAVRSFKGKVYWGDEAGVYVETGDEMDPYEETGIAWDMQTDDNFLYVAGTDTAWRFDGEDWKTLTLIFDRGFRLV